MVKTGQRFPSLSCHKLITKASRKIGYVVSGTKPFILSYHLQWAASFFFFFFFTLRFISFWQHWVLRCCAGCLQLLRVGATFCLRWAGFSLQWFLLLWSADSRACGHQQPLSGSSALAHGLWLLRGMWILPGPGIEPLSPPLVGGFFTTEPRQLPACSLRWWVPAGRKER